MVYIEKVIVALKMFINSREDRQIEVPVQGDKL